MLISAKRQGCEVIYCTKENICGKEYGQYDIVLCATKVQVFGHTLNHFSMGALGKCGMNLPRSWHFQYLLGPDTIALCVSALSLMADSLGAYGRVSLRLEVSADPFFAGLLSVVALGSFPRSCRPWMMKTRSSALSPWLRNRFCCAAACYCQPPWLESMFCKWNF